MLLPISKSALNPKHSWGARGGCREGGLGFKGIDTLVYALLNVYFVFIWQQSPWQPPPLHTPLETPV